VKPLETTRAFSQRQFLRKEKQHRCMQHETIQ